MLELSGKPTSANVQKALWTARECGVAFRHLPEHPALSDESDAAYAAYRGRPAPILRDGVTVLWEANSICRYLAARSGRHDLLPQDPALRASVERWMDYQLSTVRVPIHALLRDDLAHEKVLKHAAELDACMAPLEARLARTAHLAGDGFSLADVPLGIVAYRWFLMAIPRRPTPAIERWLQGLQARPAFAESVMPPVNTRVALT